MSLPQPSLQMAAGMPSLPHQHQGLGITNVPSMYNAVKSASDLQMQYNAFQQSGFLNPLRPMYPYAASITESDLADFSPINTSTPPETPPLILASPMQYHPAPTSAPLSLPTTPAMTHASRRKSPSPTHKDINKKATYSKWSQEEDELLRAAVQLHGSNKWSLIANHIPNRTPMQCSTRWLGALNPTIHKGRWTDNEDHLLRTAVHHHEAMAQVDEQGNLVPVPWNRIASNIPNRTGIQCQARWSEALDPAVRKGKWSPDEDSLLMTGVSQYGRCWIRIADSIHGRTQRQCRTRWMQIRNKQTKATSATSVASHSSLSAGSDRKSLAGPTRR